MNVLKDKSYKNYDKLSRYATFPYYYNTLDGKYIYGITSHLSKSTQYQLYTTVSNDTLDSIALNFYGNPTFYWVIADFNNIKDVFKVLNAGTKLKLPVLSLITFEE